MLEIAEVPGNPDAFVVRGHEARLGRVLTNLLDNAISFSPENGMVTVVARRVGAEVELVVDDEGPGIPSDKLEDIFKRFYSDRPQTDRTVGKNSGLGLSISREIVQAYGGRIWAAIGRWRQAPRRSRSTSRPSCATGAQPGWPAHASPCACRPRMPPHPEERHRLPDAAELVHGTCVALGRSAALLRGPSGSGKSDLALRFLFLARRGPAALEPPTLVADDQVRLRRDGARLLVEAPATLRGKLEVRGVGIVEMKSVAEAELVLVADLVDAGDGGAHARGWRHGDACSASTSPPSAWSRRKPRPPSSLPWRCARARKT